MFQLALIDDYRIFSWLLLLIFCFYGLIYPWIEQKGTEREKKTSRVLFWIFLTIGMAKAPISISKRTLLLIAVFLYESEKETNSEKKCWKKIVAYLGLVAFLLFTFFGW